LAQIFPKSANRLPIFLALGGILVPVLATGGIWYYGSPWYTDVGYRPKQPVPYSHKLHVGELGLDCRYCHASVEVSPVANVPPTKACMNCHIMRPQYDSWSKGSHHAVAKCVDCHLPHEFIPKYIAKADNGYRHSKAFTLQDFHEPIQITPRNSRILQNNCVTCHGELVHPLVAGSSTARNAISCVHCHADVGHGPTAGLGR